jgi:hypothetical protein
LFEAEEEAGGRSFIPRVDAETGESEATGLVGTRLWSWKVLLEGKGECPWTSLVVQDWLDLVSKASWQFSMALDEFWSFVGTRGWSAGGLENSKNSGSSEEEEDVYLLSKLISESSGLGPSSPNSFAASDWRP